MAWALNLTLDVELLAPGQRICILVLWVLNMLDSIIVGSMYIGQEVTKQGFPLDLLDKLMVCEVNEPSRVVLALEDPCWPFQILPFTHTLSSPGITYTFRHMCCQSHHVAW